MKVKGKLSLKLESDNQHGFEGWHDGVKIKGEFPSSDTLAEILEFVDKLLEKGPTRSVLNSLWDELYGSKNAHIRYSRREQ